MRFSQGFNSTDSSSTRHRICKKIYIIFSDKF